MAYVGQRESDRRFDQERRRQQQRREQGLPHGGRRPFGWHDQMEADPAEADAIRDAMEAVVRGVRETRAAGDIEGTVVCFRNEEPVVHVRLRDGHVDDIHDPRSPRSQSMWRDSGVNRGDRGGLSSRPHPHRGLGRPEPGIRRTSFEDSDGRPGQHSRMYIESNASTVLETRHTSV